MRKLQRYFVNERGELRTGWRVILGAAVGFGMLFGIQFLLGFAFGQLFDAWGLTNDNLAYAPMFVQQIVYWHTDFTYIAAYAASILAGALLARRWTKAAPNDAKLAGVAVMAGIGCGVLLSTTALMLDSMRLEWPLREISLSLSRISGAIVLLLGCLCSEVLGKRLIFDPVRQRFGRWIAYVLMAVLAVFANLTPLGVLNSVLLALIGCAIYERGGIMASAALQAGWMLWTKLVFAWPDGSSASMYRMYTVSDVWLTGGNAGAEAGLGCTIVWMIIAAILLRKELTGLMDRMNKRRSTNG